MMTDKYCAGDQTFNLRGTYYRYVEQLSFSKIQLKLTVRGKGVAEADVFRHLAPVTVGTLLRSLPLEGRISRFNGVFVYLPSSLILGLEKARSRFRKGELTLLASNGALCVFLKDASVAKPMNPLGNLTSGIELFESASSGDVVSVTA